MSNKDCPYTGKTFYYDGTIFRVLAWSPLHDDYTIEVLSPDRNKHLSGIGTYQLEHATLYAKYLFDKELEEIINE